MRKRIYQIIEHSKTGDVVSTLYDIVMFLAIIACIIPLAFHNDYPLFHVINQVTVTLFIIDYLLRWMTADLRLGKKGWSFVLYPFTAWAIVDLLSILPGLRAVPSGFKLLRLARLMRILRLFKYLRYSEHFIVLAKVFKKEKGVLLAVLAMAVCYVFVTALIMFNAEPTINPATGELTFETFFDALYWATVTLTTVGYGDLVPVSTAGRLVSMVSALFGVAIIALPSGVITAAYLDELREIKHKKTPADKKEG